MIGQIVGHYRIEAKLAEGGMGVVYKAHDTHLDRPVAIKVLSAEAVSDPERKKRFVQEARTASALNHPNILHIYDIDQADGIDYIAMEFVPGKTLHHLAGSMGLPLAQALRYAVQMADALARAHTAGIVHRDIKPANVMVTEEGLVKVLDFGLAKLTEPAEESVDSDPTRSLRASGPLTESGAILGTIAYMSPEQAEGKRVDARSDIFSFGSVLYEMVTGRHPFQGASKLATLSAILSKEPAPLLEILGTAPPELDQIVTRCLRKEPERRFQHMSDLKVALEEVRDTLRQPSAVTARPSSTSAMGETGRRARLWFAPALAVLGLVAALAISPRLRERIGLQRPGPETPVAVLSFETNCPEPAGQAFCEGLVENVKRKLSSLDQFQRAARIAPPGDVRTFAVRDAAEARKMLGAGLALTGRVERSAASLRWSATLIDSATLRQRQRLQVEVPLRDTSALQTGLAERTAKLLDLDLPPKAHELLATGNTSVPEAYDLFLQAHGRLQRPNRGEELDRAIGLFQQAIEKDPAFGLAHAGLAEAYGEKSAGAIGRQWAEKARESGLHAIAAKAGLAPVYVALGRALVALDRSQEAVNEFQRATELDPRNGESYARLAAAYESLGRLADTEAAYQKLIKLRPNYFMSHNPLAAFYVRQGRYKDAEPAFRQVAHLAPENSLGYRNLGAVYHLLGRPDEAVVMLKKSLAIKPTGAAYSNLGTLYFFQGRYSDAVPLMEKAVELDPKKYLYWGNLADAYRWAPERKASAPPTYRKAVELAERELANNPNDAVLLASMAVYHAKLPDSVKALETISRARRMAPTDPNVLFKSAMVYEITGRRDQAIGALDLALQGGYSAEEARREPDLADLRKDPRYARQAGR
ncbi:MAG: protein kinase [Acidobacteria bacterium]|nr:protein kinase [Acidobacteriota bacterium]